MFGTTELPRVGRRWLAALAPALLMTLLMTLLIAGCGGGAGARLERGLEQEARGEPLQAALSYISALERDGTLDEARARLEDLAPTLSQVWEGRIANFQQAGDALGAGEQTLTLQEILVRSPGVGVPVSPPPNWPQHRASILTGANEASLRRSREEGSDGRWSEGIQILRTALERYEPSPRHEATMHELWTSHLVSWGEAELADGRPRAGFLRLEEAHARLTPGDPLLRRISNLQAQALEMGSIRVAFLPLDATERARELAPAGFPEALNELLQLERWTVPPPFVLTASPVDVRRELDRVRREATRRSQVTPATDAAVDVGRAVGAQRTVITEVEAFVWDTSGVRIQERAATLQGGGNTVYRVRTGTVRMAATVGFLVVDPSSRRTVDQRSFTIRTSAPLEEGIYAGNPDVLDLSNRDRLLFTPSQQAAREAEAVEELQDLLAERLAEELFGRLVASVP
ncbi:MAG: hypothetical protein WEA09_09230 [Gemmatimonadota bacterium]